MVDFEYIWSEYMPSSFKQAGIHSQRIDFSRNRFYYSSSVVPYKQTKWLNSQRIGFNMNRLYCISSVTPYKQTKWLHSQRIGFNMNRLYCISLVDPYRQTKWLISTPVYNIGSHPGKYFGLDNLIISSDHAPLTPSNTTNK